MYSVLLWMLTVSCRIGGVDSDAIEKARAKRNATDPERFDR